MRHGTVVGLVRARFVVLFRFVWHVRVAGGTYGRLFRVSIRLSFLDIIIIMLLAVNFEWPWSTTFAFIPPGKLVLPPMTNLIPIFFTLERPFHLRCGYSATPSSFREAIEGNRTAWPASWWGMSLGD
jgi:hypothetical protein